MTYNATYTSEDADDIVVDGFAKIAVAVLGFATLIGLVFVYRWFRGKKVMS